MTVEIMENANIDELDMDITTFSDVELAKKLHELGANIGPITWCMVETNASSVVRSLKLSHVDHASTRSVYQRKLQRWLKYGSNHSMMVVSSPSHSSVVEESTTSPSSPVHEELSFNEGINIEPPKQIENKCTDDLVKKSDANLHTDAPLACDLSAQLERDGENSKETPKQRRQNLPVVSQEDIDFVDRIMVSTAQSASYEAASYQSVSFESSESNDYSTGQYSYQESDEESLLRSRYVTHNVTPRPSLKSYRENMGKNFSGDSITRGRGSFSSSPRNEPSTPLTDVNSSTRLGSTTARWRMLLVTVVGLVIVAVVYNMEPSYVNRLEQ